MTTKKIAHETNGTKSAPVGRENGAGSDLSLMEDRIRRQMNAAYAPKLVKATDIAGEALAVLDCDATGMRDRISELNAILWGMRWDLLVTSGSVEWSEDERAEDADEQTAGGAS